MPGGHRVCVGICRPVPPAPSILLRLSNSATTEREEKTSNAVLQSLHLIAQSAQKMSLAAKLGRLASRLGPHRAAWASLRATYSSHRATRTATPVLAAGKQLQVAHILVKPEEEEVLADLEQRIKAGESFASLAKEYSQCPSKRQGGDLGWIARGRTVPEFEQAAFAATPGELVKVQTPFGWHLLTVLREAAEVAPLNVQDLAEMLAAASAAGESDTQFVDVREEGELRLAALPHFKLFPLSRFEEWGPQIKQLLDPSKETVVLCHHGVRSMQMSQFLLGEGFSDVKNVTGGIDAYSRGVDPNVPKY